MSTPQQGKILNYGSVNIDEFFSVPHICKSGETLSSTNYFVRGGGKGANQSIALAKAEGRVFHAGNFGEDAKWIFDFMKENGVDMKHAKVKEGEKNGRAFIQVSEETRDNCIVLYPGTNATNTTEDASKVLESFGPGDWIVQQNEINQGGTIMRLAAEKGLKVLFNPAPMTEGVLEEFPFDKVTVLIVNEHEAASLVKQLGIETELSDCDLAAKILEKFEHMQGVVVTLGKDGVSAMFRNNDQFKSFNVPSRKVAVKDTTGAGDTFVGFFLAALIRSESEVSDYFDRVTIALQEANFASSIAVQREGSMVSVPTLEEVRASIKN